ncbi:MAG TPA: fumarylacetoacetate hydrolase family protein [Burkholderiales bacterium]|nr:fumarylacetoacetate hydrolase family protein [Burkholderiales bacterium]
MEHHAIGNAASIIWSTWQANRHIDALPVECRPATRVEAYRVQAQVARLSGQKIFGWKIAATSKAGQQHIGVDGPLAGRLLEKRVFPSGANVSLANNIMKVAEAEFAFRMAYDLPPRKTPYSLDEVIAAVAGMHPAIEIPDSRYRDFVSVGAAQLIADNACASYFVLGPATIAEWRQYDLAKHPVTAQVNGKLAREGRGENVLGDPRIALTWIANELSLVGDMLRSWETITTGTCVTPVPIDAGDHVVADFGPFGRVEARLVS